MALLTLPPEPLVQGRSMRTGTAEATTTFAIFHDRYNVAVVREIARDRDVESRSGHPWPHFSNAARVRWPSELRDLRNGAVFRLA
jgi:hypothetical protein